MRSNGQNNRLIHFSNFFFFQAKVNEMEFSEDQISVRHLSYLRHCFLYQVARNTIKKAQRATKFMFFHPCLT